ncbi:hypothetical protein TRIATDRAFT_86470 [Trichoderma atroviride IMI 206040]|uniref:Uncharacterized protein n=1 Tax=Hypocrea atroviridis (strain ATCC 20476 / IMI 206040) TaxID=452589 RepID=G9P2C2_HYPAI|nr:uncharacterized protein TRIATDRAFT_86470 [Trichoderma atroviride IMI 206040]EHK42661.1 hypothetical protein TRIATDRAFT_86470 [Trichoderma atroviride IMI 206040]
MFPNLLCHVYMLCTTPALACKNTFRHQGEEKAREIITDQAGNVYHPNLYSPAIISLNKRDRESNPLNLLNRDSRISTPRFFNASIYPVFCLRTLLQMANGLFDTYHQSFTVTSHLPTAGEHPLQPPCWPSFENVPLHKVQEITPVACRLQSRILSCERDCSIFKSPAADGQELSILSLAERARLDGQQTGLLPSVASRSRELGRHLTKSILYKLHGHPYDYRYIGGGHYRYIVQLKRHVAIFPPLTINQEPLNGLKNGIASSVDCSIQSSKKTKSAQKSRTSHIGSNFFGSPVAIKTLFDYPSSELEVSLTLL